MGKFEIREEFYLDNERIKIISGGLHYFRVVPEYWRDRLEKLKALGCNTVETYVAWNVHEPREGEFHFEGGQDLARFIRIAQELELMVIVRPSPFICAEWEFGGLPAWLLNKPGIRLRTSCPIFLESVEQYYERLFQILSPLQIDRGGPIIMMQLENEYGSYGNDKEYLKSLKKMMEALGCTVPLVTSDGPQQQTLRDGTLPDVLPTANFGSRTQERFGVLKDFIGDKPLMCMEYWIGWFDVWGDKQHSRSDLEQNKKDFDDMLRMGHANIYMFHGGTNFGFMNGSNYYDHLEPDVTSYDYDAVLTEDGQPTPKYNAFQEIIAKHREIPSVEFTTRIQRKSYGELHPAARTDLFSALADISRPVFSSYTKSMEQLGQSYGYILYRSAFDKGRKIEGLKLSGAADRAILFGDQKQLAVRYDLELEESFSLALEKEEVQLDILVENMGRVNYGPRMGTQRKGISDGVIVNNAYHFGWEHYCLPLDNLDQLDFGRGYQEGRPAFYRFAFQAEETGDTFLDTSGWGKGCAFVNGVNIGRFWEAGPQKRLYIPAPLLRTGENEIILFETDGKAGGSIRLEAEPGLE